MNLAAGLTSLLKEVNQSIDRLEAAQATSWQDTVDPYEIVNDRLNVAWGVVDHLQASSLPCDSHVPPAAKCEGEPSLAFVMAMDCRIVPKIY
jgi:hypothetical protein